MRNLIRFTLKSSTMNTILLVSLLFAGALAAPNDWRIVGGKDAEEGQFPYQISLRADGSHNCGGSVIDPNTFLTAAHCVSGWSVSRLTVVVGTNDVKGVGQSCPVSSYAAHENYKPFFITDDIAVLRTNVPVEYNNIVQPIPLNTDFTGAGVECVLSGWGMTNYPGPSADKLQFINLITISNEDCYNQVGSVTKPIKDSQVCTFTKEGEGACKGDSGGPLVSNGKQIGVVSWGQPCARGKPDVFTRVSSYLDWIEQNKY